MGQEIAHFLWNTGFNSLWGVHDFAYSLNIFIYLILNLSVLGLCLRINEFGLFAWISLTALSWDLFYYKSRSLNRKWPLNS